MVAALLIVVLVQLAIIIWLSLRLLGWRAAAARSVDLTSRALDMLAEKCATSAWWEAVARRRPAPEAGA